MENTSQSPEDQNTRSRSALADKIKQDGRERVERGKQAAADQVEQLADALDQAGSKLNDGQPTVASYATRLADGLDHLAQRLRTSSLEDLARDTRTAAISNPGAYLLSSAAVGLLLARFLKASIDRDAADPSSSDSFGSGDAFGSSQVFGADASGDEFAAAPASDASRADAELSGSASAAQGTSREPASTRGIH